MMARNHMVDFAASNGLKPEDTWYSDDTPSMTRQEFRDECDINTIMARYDSYLADPMASLHTEPRYVDLVNTPSTLMEAMAALKEGEDAFMRLPAIVRKEFDNDPIRFVDFACDPVNIDRMREWGLAPPAPPPAAPAANGSPDPQGAPGAQAPGAPASSRSPAAS